MAILPAFGFHCLKAHRTNKVFICPTFKAIDTCAWKRKRRYPKNDIQRSKGIIALDLCFVAFHQNLIIVQAHESKLQNDFSDNINEQDERERRVYRAA